MTRPSLSVVRLLRPRSLLQLTLLGFALVALPLIAGLVYTALYLQSLSSHSQQAVFRAVSATRGSSSLVELAVDMERVVRQYQVVGDRSLLEVYQRSHDDFVTTTARIDKLPLDEEQRERLEHLQAVETRVHDRLIPGVPEEKALREAVIDLLDISDLGRALLDDSRILVGREVQIMEADAARARDFLYWQAAALGPATLIFAALFIVLINRPISYVEEALRRLGDGQFALPIQVKGPRDLEELGERLDWLRRRLVELEEEKTKFLHQVSHELKTPLAALREGTDLLAEGVVGPLSEAQQEIADILKGNAASLQRLIGDLLDFSMARSEHTSLLAAPVRLDVLVREVMADHRPPAIAKGLVLRSELSRVTLRGDARKLRTVVDNLLSNAVKFSPSGGTLVVRLERVEENAMLEVEDDGPGISEEEREKVFEAFYQGRHAGGGHLKGTGIGLSIAREYVLAHGGHIAALQPREQAGGRLRVTLPLNPSSSRAVT